MVIMDYCSIVNSWLTRLLLGSVYLWTNGVFSLVEWGEWSSCSQLCGGGIQTRNGTCDGCMQRRACNTNRCRDTALMVWVVIGVTIIFLAILVIFLVGIFFVKPDAERKLSRKSSFELLESTPGASRRVRTCTVDTNVDYKLSTLRSDCKNSQPSALDRRL
ncbi:uncharacterized protein LOC110246101 [Exaiptasia diaphana]|uniref:Uncharacterized protein n=1 Tax=Exaiptasia diaphana TaxID=2652724 RepID=A0A913XR91_EXADI|nr:uncharacterized protein LOC110246036 [Exaiptasia diaphana]XP_020908069.1 uncharacterized protein LOC110246101 [Exaiptasia diaphana]KXJ25202.1 hypothetical protein AC249_AIPGENE22538 [Exaiptasia diaphana]